MPLCLQYRCKEGIEMVGEHFLGRSLSVAVLSGMGLVGICCATPMGGEHRLETDLRGTVGATNSEPRLLVAGPGVLLHLDVDRRRNVTLFRVARRDGTAADCIVGPPVNGEIIEMPRGSLNVNATESLCATVAQGATLTWHARARTPASRPMELVHEASLP
jgi:hypothetical protein